MKNEDPSVNVRQIQLGSTGVEVSEMVFGGAPIGDLYAPVSDDQAAAALEAAWGKVSVAPHYALACLSGVLGEPGKQQPVQSFPARQTGSAATLCDRTVMAAR